MLLLKSIIATGFGSSGVYQLDFAVSRGYILPQVAVMLLSGMFAYDIWWVFIQPLVTSSESVMIAVRRKPKHQAHRP